jgi:hypothetical protein
MRFYYTAQSILLDRIFALRNIIEPLLFIYLFLFFWKIEPLLSKNNKKSKRKYASITG